MTYYKKFILTNNKKRGEEGQRRYSVPQGESLEERSKDLRYVKKNVEHFSPYNASQPLFLKVKNKEVCH